MDTTYRKNLKAVLTASKNYTDNSIEKLKWELGTYDLSITTDSTVAYTKTIPTNTIKGRINYIGGASKVSKNLKDLSYPTINYYRNNNTTFIATSDTSTNRIRTESVPFKANNGAEFYINNIPSNITLLGVGAFDSEQQTISNAISVSGNKMTINASGVEYIFLLFSGSNFDGNTKTLFNQIGIFKTNIYEPYFENIRSAKTTSVKFEGANVLNPDNTFTYSSYTDLAYFECVGGAIYTLKSFGSYTGSFGIFKYDGNSWSSIEAHTLNSGYTITAPSDAIRIGVNGVVSQSVMVVRGTTAPTEFKPYIAPITKAIPQEVLNDVRYGLGFSDTQFNKLNLITKHLTGEWNIVDLGTLDWLLSGVGDNARFITLSIGSLISKGTTNLRCTKYTAVSWDNLVNSNDDMIMASRTSDGYLGIRNLAYTDAQAFKQAMSGVYLLYQTATQFDVDFSQYIDDDFKNIDTTNMGTITFENEFGYDVPSEIDYLIEEVKA